MRGSSKPAQHRPPQRRTSSRNRGKSGSKEPTSRQQESTKMEQDQNLDDASGTAGATEIGGARLISGPGSSNSLQPHCPRRAEAEKSQNTWRRSPFMKASERLPPPPEPAPPPEPRSIPIPSARQPSNLAPPAHLNLTVGQKNSISTVAVSSRSKNPTTQKPPRAPSKRENSQAKTRASNPQNHSHISTRVGIPQSLSLATPATNIGVTPSPSMMSFAGGVPLSNNSPTKSNLSIPEDASNDTLQELIRAAQARLHHSTSSSIGSPSVQTSAPFAHHHTHLHNIEMDNSYTTPKPSAVMSRISKTSTEQIIKDNSLEEEEKSEGDSRSQLSEVYDDEDGNGSDGDGYQPLAEEDEKGEEEEEESVRSDLIGPKESFKKGKKKQLGPSDTISVSKNKGKKANYIDIPRSSMQVQQKIGMLFDEPSHNGLGIPATPTHQVVPIPPTEINQPTGTSTGTNSYGFTTSLATTSLNTTALDNSKAAATSVEGTQLEEENNAVILGSRDRAVAASFPEDMHNVVDAIKKGIRIYLFNKHGFPTGEARFNFVINEFILRASCAPTPKERNYFSNLFSTYRGVVTEKAKAIVPTMYPLSTLDDAKWMQQDYRFLFKNANECLKQQQEDEDSFQDIFQHEAIPAILRHSAFAGEFGSALSTVDEFQGTVTNPAIALIATAIKHQIDVAVERLSRAAPKTIRFSEQEYHGTYNYFIKKLEDQELDLINDAERHALSVQAGGPQRAEASTSASPPASTSLTSTGGFSEVLFKRRRLNPRGHGASQF